MTSDLVDESELQRRARVVGIGAVKYADLVSYNTSPLATLS